MHSTVFNGWKSNLLDPFALIRLLYMSVFAAVFDVTELGMSVLKYKCRCHLRPVTSLITLKKHQKIGHLRQYPKFLTGFHNGDL